MRLLFLLYLRTAIHLFDFYCERFKSGFPDFVKQDYCRCSECCLLFRAVVVDVRVPVRHQYLAKSDLAGAPVVPSCSM